MFSWVWTIGDLLDAALAAVPPLPTPDRAGSATAVPGNRTGSQMMNFLCGPNGVLAAGAGVGALAAIIWSAIDPRFTFDPQDPLFQAKYQFSKLIVVLGAGVGAVIGLILNQFIRHMC